MNPHVLIRDVGRPVERTAELLARAWHRCYWFKESRLLGKRYIRKRVNSYSLWLDAQDPGISTQLLRFGTREAEQRYLVERHVQPGMSVLDVGANIGYYTLMLAQRVGAAGHVLAIEPHPQNVALLRRNLALNGLATIGVEQAALARADGERRLYATRQSNWHSLRDPRDADAERWSEARARAIVAEIPVKTVSFASCLEIMGHVDLMRMDVEGSEVEILQSLLDVPSQPGARPHVLFETHPEFYGTQALTLRGILQELCAARGYRIECLVSDFHFGSRHTRARGKDVFARLGYGRSHIHKQFRNRAIYSGVRTEHAIQLICESEHVNAALLLAE